MRVGFGFDIHPFGKDRELVLGGVKIPYEKGLEGHSDADVLIHAICDALIGSIGEGDIGRHFPDDDPAYKGISSLSLLSRVKEMLIDRGATISNIDSTILCEEPKLAGYIQGMREMIASTLGISQERVNIKATRGEGLGFVGRREGIAACAIVSIMVDE